MPRSRERAKEISAVKSHVRLSSVHGAPGSLFQLCLLQQGSSKPEAAQSVSEPGTRPSALASWWYEQVEKQLHARGLGSHTGVPPSAPLVTQHCKPRAHACCVYIPATCQGVRERRGLQQDQGRCGPIPGGLPLGEAPVSLLIVTPNRAGDQQVQQPLPLGTIAGIVTRVCREICTAQTRLGGALVVES